MIQKVVIPTQMMLQIRYLESLIQKKSELRTFLKTQILVQISLKK